MRTVEDQRTVFAESGVDLEVLAGPDEVWLYGDRTRLTQTVGNLLQNAAKFTARGGSVTISVAADVSRAEGPEAVLTVRDTGVGIAPEMMPRLFETFAQADRTLDRSRGGSALGLRSSRVWSSCMVARSARRVTVPARAQCSRFVYRSRPPARRPPPTNGALTSRPRPDGFS